MTPIALVFALSVVLAVLIGPAGGLGIAESAGALLGLSADATAAALIHEIRLPRVAGGAIVGALLAVSGVTLQAIARNPLVAPDIVGISSGAAFGAALAIMADPLPVVPAAFIGGGIAALATHTLAARDGRVSTLSLVLAGIAVSALFTALLALVQALIDVARLASLVHWLLGSLQGVDRDRLPALLLPFIAVMAVLWRWRWRLDALALGDDAAHSAGLDVPRAKALLLALAVLAAATAVATAGSIALVGLIVPHLVRALVGAAHRRLLPAAALAGAAFVLAADIAARGLASVELPVGVFATLLSAPLLAIFLRRGDFRVRGG